MSGGFSYSTNWPILILVTRAFVNFVDSTYLYISMYGETPFLSNRYNVRMALFAFGWELPEFATGVINLERNGVPLDMNCTLTWKPDPSTGT